MTLRFSYSGHFMREMKSLRLSGFERALLIALVAMCLISALTSLSGRDIGDAGQLKIVKQAAQQELMAQRTRQLK